MRYQYIRAFIMLLAGLITLILNMKTGKDVTVSLAIELGVLVVFYFIATLLVEILQRVLEKKEEKDETEETDESGENSDVDEEDEDSDVEESLSFDEDEE